MILRSHLRLIPLVIATLAFASSAAASVVQRPDTQAFINQMVKQHGFARPALERLFDKVRLRPDIIRAISRPAESKPWRDYRPIFVTPSRIREGVDFWRHNAATLARAEKKYGVSPAVIVAILGVETRYGRHAGGFRVLDALSTLAFDYPPRQGFFRSELEHFLLMTREEGIDPLEPLGSYAGAMGQPQFIPSSFRHYAVDFDGDGHRNLWDNTKDAIGSVANYFHRHRWQPGGDVAVRAKVQGDGYKKVLEMGVKPGVPAGKLPEFGIHPRAKLPGDEPVALVELEAKGGPEYWVTFQNFYVITRYNRSPLYAMAVYQLSEAIKKARSMADNR